MLLSFLSIYVKQKKYKTLKKLGHSVSISVVINILIYEVNIFTWSKTQMLNHNGTLLIGILILTNLEIWGYR